MSSLLNLDLNLPYVAIIALGLLIVISQPGRTAIGRAYLYLTGNSPHQQRQPISYFGKNDDWPVLDSQSLGARLIKLLRGTPTTVASGRAALDKLGGGGWRHLCNFAVDTTASWWIPQVLLESWRHQVDPLADGAIRTLFAHPASSASTFDALTEVNILASTTTLPDLPIDHPPVPHPCSQFIASVGERPPRGAGALSEAWYAQRDARRKAQGLSEHSPLSADEVAEELREEARIIRAGQNVFFKYLEPMQVTLLHFSLAGGFSSAKISAVLRQTGYLVPSKDPLVEAHRSSHAAKSQHQAGGRVRAQEQKGNGNAHAAYLLPYDQLSPAHQRSADRTFTRLLETTQFAMDVMQDGDALLPPRHFADPAVRSLYKGDGGSKDEDDSHSLHVVGEEERAFLARVGGGRGWQSSVRVRLLHASVRHRIGSSIERAHKGRDKADEEGRCPFDNATTTMMTTGAAGVYDIGQNGEPINQEDMLATLAGFSVAPLWCLSRMGLPLTAAEREDYVAVWRHVGFYLGCEVDLLRRHFGDARTALGMLFSIVGHIYPESVTRQLHGPEEEEEEEGGNADEDQDAETPAEQGTVAALALLQAVANKPPLKLSMETHCAVSRHFLGPCLSDYLRIPRTSPWHQFIVDMLLLSALVPAHFTSACPLYPRALRTRWLRRRVRLAKMDVRRTLRRFLGGKLATFGGSRGVVVRLSCDAKGKTGRRSVLERERRMVALEMSVFLAGVFVVGGLGGRAVLSATAHLLPWV